MVPYLPYPCTRFFSAFPSRPGKLTSLGCFTTILPIALGKQLQKAAEEESA